MNEVATGFWQEWGERAGKDVVDKSKKVTRIVPKPEWPQPNVIDQWKGKGELPDQESAETTSPAGV